MAARSSRTYGVTRATGVQAELARPGLSGLYFRAARPNWRLLCRSNRDVVSRNHLHIDFFSDTALKSANTNARHLGNDRKLPRLGYQADCVAGVPCVYVGATTNVVVSGIYDPYGGNAGTASAYGAGVVIDSAAAGNYDATAPGYGPVCPS